MREAFLHLRKRCFVTRKFLFLLGNLSCRSLRDELLVRKHSVGTLQLALKAGLLGRETLNLLRYVYKIGRP